MLPFTELAKIILLYGSMQAQASGIVTTPDHFRLSMLSEVIVTGHVHFEIIERMGNAHAGFIESDHAANFSHDPHGCRLTLGSIW